MPLVAEQPQNREVAFVENVRVIFLRMVALFLLIFTVQYWMRAIGLYEGPEVRFDTMQTHWQIAVAVLSVLLPVAALGLWGLFSWGVPVWIIAATIQLGMHLGFADLFGVQRLTAAFHASSLLVYIFIRVALVAAASRARVRRRSE